MRRGICETRKLETLCKKWRSVVLPPTKTPIRTQKRNGNANFAIAYLAGAPGASHGASPWWIGEGESLLAEALLISENGGK